MVELNQSFVFVLELVLVADIVVIKALTSISVGQAFDKSSIKLINPFFKGSGPCNVASNRCLNNNPVSKKILTKCLSTFINDLCPALGYSSDNLLPIRRHPPSTCVNDTSQSLHSRQLQARLDSHMRLGDQAVTQLSNEGLQVSHNGHIDYRCYLRNDVIRRLEECRLSVAIRPCAANYVVPQKGKAFLIMRLGAGSGKFSAKS